MIPVNRFQFVRKPIIFFLLLLTGTVFKSGILILLIDKIPVHLKKVITKKLAKIELTY
jgi:hypothetical protein